ncbi:M20 metallopeptidase family protein [Macrococcus animalis]|uniref:M20 metallopeptidase family protein n=1 Tax=Macrococcus animalis TaxID=3395467 RepID=UPI0039BE3E5F
MSDYQQYEARVIAYRRHLHQYPEPSFEEYETAKYIREILHSMEHCEVIELTETGTVGVFNKGGRKKIGLRADIDALPIDEDRDDIAFVSQNEGLMHACGHDGHTAILLGAAHYFNDHYDELDNEVHCIFQHAEELIPGGARELVETGYFEGFDFIYGHHLWAQLPLGLIDVKPGPASANSDIYAIEIQGKGGHASRPEGCIDPVLIGSRFVESLQSIVSRNISPYDSAVVSNTLFQAGAIGSLNVIPDKVVLGGSVRTTTDENRKLIKDKIEQHLKHICEMHGATFKMDYTIGYSAVYNEEKHTEWIKALAESLYPEQVVTDPPMMGGEDFSAFNQVAPCVYTFIGTGSTGFDYQHHHPKFGLNEDGFEAGFLMFIEVATKYQGL